MHSKQAIDYSGKILIFLALLVIPFLHSPMLIDPVLLPGTAGLAVLVSLASLYMLLNSGLISSNFPHASRPVVWSWIIYLSFSSLSLFVSVNPADGIFEILKALLFFLFPVSAFLLLGAGESRPWFFIARCTVIFSLIINLHGLAQLMAISSFPSVSHHDTYAVKSFFAHRNLFSEVVFLTLPFTVFGLIRWRGFYRIAALLAAFLSVITITITLSRAVWLALLAGLLSVVVLYAANTKPWNHVSSKNLKALIPRFVLPFAGTLVLAAIAVYYASPLDSFETFEKQVHGMVNFHYGTSFERIELWKRSLEMFRESPVTGQGLGAWKIEILKYGSEGLQSEDAVTFFQRPHNDFIWVLSESGLLAFLSYAALFFSALYVYLRKFWKEPDSELKTLYLLMAGGITGYLTLAQFSFPKERPVQQIFLAFLFLPLFIENVDREFPVRFKRLMLTFFITLGVIIAFVTGIRIQSEAALSRAFHYRQLQRWDKVVEFCGKSDNKLYRMDPMSTPVSWYTGSALFNLGRTKSALIEFEHAYRINPWHIHVLNNLATCYELLGRHQEAEEYYLKALSVQPDFDDALFNLAAVYFNSGKFDDAYENIRKATPLRPEYRRFVLSVAPVIAKRFAGEISEETLRSEIIKIAGNPDWLFEVHEKSLANNISLQKQLILDAVYVLLNGQKIITFDESISLIDKYSG